MIAKVLMLRYVIFWCQIIYKTTTDHLLVEKADKCHYQGGKERFADVLDNSG